MVAERQIAALTANTFIERCLLLEVIYKDLGQVLRHETVSERELQLALFGIFRRLNTAKEE